MTSNRIGGPTPGEPGKGPDTRMQEQHRRIEKVEKVRAVDETENEQTRKKFQKFMDDDEEPKPKPKEPSPFETGFHRTGKGAEGAIFSPSIGTPSSLEDLEGDIVSSPSYSPPPNCSQAPAPEEEESPPLPQSHNFWSDVDSPPDQPLKNPRFQEAQRSTSRHPSSQKKETSPDEKKKKDALLALQKSETESLHGLSGKALEEKKKKIAEEKEREATSHKTKASPLQAQSEIAMSRSKDKTEEKESEPSFHTKKTKEGALPPLPTDLASHSSHEKKFGHDKEGEEKNKERKTNPIEIENPSQSRLPATVIPLAQAATTQAATYLSPQIAPLYFQMVGTIYMMTTTSGVSKTEILLNAPAFANSKFYGSTISIEKYATAPDSLNIRLTGTNEAVLTFNKNISNLYAAFQNGNFNFKIGRISAEYSVDKPVFRRKESGEGKKDSGGGDFSDKRGNK